MNTQVPGQPNRGKAIGAGILVAVLAIAGGLVHKHEPDRRHPNLGYWDKIGHVATACEGHTGGVIVGHIYTDAQCAEWKRQDLMRAVNTVNRCIHVELTAPQGGGLVDGVYNLGAALVCGSKLQREINSGVPPIIWCQQLKRWNHGNGLVIRSLTNRRYDDLQECIK